jgi:hypothetical protein
VPKLDIDALRKAVGEDRYRISFHAKFRMGQRKVADRDVEQVVETGDVIERHPRARPFPKALSMAHVRTGPLYVCCAYDGFQAYLITVYWYDPAKWVDPWTRRKGGA